MNDDNVIPLLRRREREPPQLQLTDPEALVYAAGLLLVGGDVRIVTLHRHPSGPVAACSAVCTDHGSAYVVTYTAAAGYSCTCPLSVSGESSCVHVVAVERVVYAHDRRPPSRS